LELGAVVFALRLWRHYLYGTKCTANVVADALSKKDKEPIRVRALVVTVHNNLHEQIRSAQVEACKEENIGAERFVGEGEPFEVRSDGTKCLKGRARSACVDYFRPRPSFRVKFLEVFTRVVGDKFGYEHCLPSQTNGQSKRTIQTLEDMLRACVIDFGSRWDKHLPLAEFSYNNSYHASIKAAPFEALYGRKCRSHVCWSEVGDAQLTRPEMIRETTEIIVQIKNRLLAARSRQKSYADVKRKPLEFEVGDKVMLKVSPWKEHIHEKTEKIVQIKQRIQAARDHQKSYAEVRRKPLEFQVGDRVMLKLSPWKEVV
nr:reverse transcriptase domain-containing protein [Tanacetum cinerariifolium]